MIDFARFNELMKKTKDAVIEMLKLEISKESDKFNLEIAELENHIDDLIKQTIQFGAGKYKNSGEKMSSEIVSEFYKDLIGGIESYLERTLQKRAKDGYFFQNSKFAKDPRVEFLNKLNQASNNIAKGMNPNQKTFKNGNEIFNQFISDMNFSKAQLQQQVKQQSTHYPKETPPLLTSKTTQAKKSMAQNTNKNFKTVIESIKSSFEQFKENVKLNFKKYGISNFKMDGNDKLEINFFKNMATKQGNITIHAQKIKEGIEFSINTNQEEEDKKVAIIRACMLAVQTAPAGAVLSVPDNLPKDLKKYAESQLENQLKISLRNDVFIKLFEKVEKSEEKEGKKFKKF